MLDPIRTLVLATETRLMTSGMTEAAARAVIRAGGRVPFERSPGVPVFAWTTGWPALYLPAGTVLLERSGPFSNYQYKLPTGDVVSADCQCLLFRLSEVTEGCPDQAENGVTGYWGRDLRSPGQLKT
jgi:hypothetical protein